MSRSLIKRYFGKIAGQPCWHVTAEFGTWLSLNFGAPSLRVEGAVPDSDIPGFRRRRVFVDGEALLWIEMGAWELLMMGRRIHHSSQSRHQLRKAAAQLDGQKLLSVNLQVDPLATTFIFEEECELRVFVGPDLSSDDPLWHLYVGKGCISLIADGTLEYGQSNSNQPKSCSVQDFVIPL
jgi:hypothetical protein